jgi:bifunctional non-homologous end joining protein LigD
MSIRRALAFASERSNLRGSIDYTPAVTRTSATRMSLRCSPPIDPNFISPCLPCNIMAPPSGDAWLHEVKNPGDRLIACRNSDGIRLFSERGEDWTARFPFLAQSMELLPVRSCILDGDLVRCDENGDTLLAPVRYGDSETGASLYAFDLLEVNGFDVRHDPIEERKRALGRLLSKPPAAIRVNETFDRCSESMLQQLCSMGYDGVISKRRGSRYLSGRSPDWLFSRSMDRVSSNTRRE